MREHYRMLPRMFAAGIWPAIEAAALPLAIAGAARRARSIPAAELVHVRDYYRMFPRHWTSGEAELSELVDVGMAAIAGARRRRTLPAAELVHVREHYPMLPRTFAAGGGDGPIIGDAAYELECAGYEAAAATLDAYAGALLSGYASNPRIEVGWGLGSLVSSVCSAVSSVARAVATPVARAVQAVVAPITKTVSAAARTLVNGIRHFNPVALAKAAAIKAKALMGDLKNSVIFKTLSAVASKALAPALMVISVAGPVLPYAQSVISLVPGLGSGVSAALGAAQALADGRSDRPGARCRRARCHPRRRARTDGFRRGVGSRTRTASGRDGDLDAALSATDARAAGPRRGARDGSGQNRAGAPRRPADGSTRRDRLQRPAGPTPSWGRAPSRLTASSGPGAASSRCGAAACHRRDSVARFAGSASP